MLVVGIGVGFQLARPRRCLGQWERWKPPSGKIGPTSFPHLRLLLSSLARAGVCRREGAVCHGDQGVLPPPEPELLGLPGLQLSLVYCILVCSAVLCYICLAVVYIQYSSLLHPTLLCYSSAYAP